MNEVAIIRVFAALGLVLLCIILFGLVVRKTGFPGKLGRAGSLPVISRTPLGQRTEIVVVQAGQEHLVLGVTAQQINLLHKMPAPETAATGTKHATSKPAGNPEENLPDTPGVPGLPAEKRAFHKTLLHHLNRRFLVLPFLFGMLFLASDTVFAQALPALSSTSNPDGSETYSLSMQTLILLTGLSFLPAIILMMTGFTRIVIVLGLLRNALGTGTSPPNSVLIGLSLFLTFFVMSPVLDQITEQAYVPLNNGDITFEQAVERASVPIHTFMIGQTRETDLALFADMANISEFENREAVPMRILIPAFITSELKTAFQIGFTIFIPFLIIDLVIASVLMSLGMMMVPPVTISLPFKLMLFVLADGWHLLLGSLARSFYQ